jgi:hypothetical protein
MQRRGTQGDAGRRGGPTPRPTAGRPPLAIERTPTGYVLRDPLLVRLAGIEAVPLPFTAQARPAVVLAHLRRLNPGREVRILPPSPVP